MRGRIFLVSIAFAAVASAAAASGAAGAQAIEASKYPDWKGQWVRIGSGNMYDPDKPAGRGQQPPLTPEYQAVWESHLAEAAGGGQSFNTQVRCLPGGMPRMMMAYEPMEIIVTPDLTYIEVALNNEFRRIYTDGRGWPKNGEPSFAGYSIGKWVGEGGDRYDTLEVETRDLKGPRIFDPSGIPMHKDNMTVVKERIFLDKANPDILRDQITTIDNALTRPWTVTRSYTRERNPTWTEHVCAEANSYVFIGEETYVLSADGLLMPTRKDQTPPDLRFFKRTVP